MQVTLKLERQPDGTLVNLAKIAETMRRWTSSFAELAMTVARRTSYAT